MLLKEHKELITALIEKTKSSLINWEGGATQFSYQSIVDKNKILIDKYYSVQNSNTVTCLNLSIFNEYGKLYEEIVLCRAVAELAEDYDLLDGLYKMVVSIISAKETESKIPLLTSITQSLQHL